MRLDKFQTGRCNSTNTCVEERNLFDQIWKYFDIQHWTWSRPKTRTLKVFLLHSQDSLLPNVQWFHLANQSQSRQAVAKFSRGCKPWGRIMMFPVIGHRELLVEWSDQVNQVTMETLHLSMLPAFWQNLEIVPFKHPSTRAVPTSPIPRLEFVHCVSEA